MKRQHGYSLVELMVALALGLMLMGAVVSVFLATRQSYHQTNGGSALADNARFSTDFMNRALRSAGFVGCVSSAYVTTTGPSPPNVLFDFGNTVDGYEAASTGNGASITLSSAPTGDTNTGDWTPALPSNFSVTTVNPVTGATTTSANGLSGLAVKGSDILAVHYTLQNAPGSTQFPSPVSAFATDNLTIANATGLQVGQVAVVSDCSKAVTFQVSSITASSNILYFDSATAANSAASGTTMGNTGSALPVSFDYAQVFIPTTSIFFIGVGQDGDGALFRGDLQMVTGGSGYTLLVNEIVPDVENMQILYGLDPNNTHAATNYQTADQVGSANPTGCGTNVNGTNSFNCVDSVQVAFLVASPLQTVQQPYTVTPISFPNGVTITPPRDTRQRTVYQVTAAVRNTLP
jgi:type IV pilus assembly protein PilW